MMEKRQALLLVLSLIGILILLLLSQKLEPKLRDISGITKKNLDETVKIRGLITEAREYNNNTFQVLTIKDSTGNISAVMNAEHEVEINKSKNYTIIGKVQSYNQTLQISISKLFLE